MASLPRAPGKNTYPYSPSPSLLQRMYNQFHLHIRYLHDITIYVFMICIDNTVFVFKYVLSHNICLILMDLY